MEGWSIEEALVKALLVRLRGSIAKDPEMKKEGRKEHENFQPLLLLKALLHPLLHWPATASFLLSFPPLFFELPSTCGQGTGSSLELVPLPQASILSQARYILALAGKMGHHGSKGS